MYTFHSIHRFAECQPDACHGRTPADGSFTPSRPDASLPGGAGKAFLPWEPPSYVSSIDRFLGSLPQDPAAGSAGRAGQNARAVLRLDATAASHDHCAGDDGGDTPVSAGPTDSRSSRTQSRLLAAASHDLRQPLQTIGLWIELLHEQAHDLGERAILGKIQETSRGAERILNALLDVTKLDLGVTGVNISDFAADEVLGHVAFTFGPVAKERQLALRVRSSSAIARSDPVLLERILFNFVGNAIRHSTRGGVLVACRERTSCLSFEVWDTGPGIPQDCLGDIFEEFVQLGSPGSKRHGSGAGLGLSIAKRTAGLLGHAIQVSSTLGKGSCFRVDVPVALRPPAATAAPGCDNSAAAIFGALVVVVEDETQQREALEALLRHWGCHVVAAASAAEAIERLADHLRLPNVLIAERTLVGGKTGLGAIRAIRSATTRELPAFILTAAPPSMADTGLRETGVRVLHKPVPPAELRRQLADALIEASSRHSCVSSPAAPHMPCPARAQRRSPVYAGWR